MEGDAVVPCPEVGVGDGEVRPLVLLAGEGVPEGDDRTDSLFKHSLINAMNAIILRIDNPINQIHKPRNKIKPNIAKMQLIMIHKPKMIYFINNSFFKSKYNIPPII